MKICINCQYHVKKGVQISPQQMGVGIFCTHPDCCEPVTGDPLPCNMARTADFCTLKGLKFKAIEKKVEPDKATVIQLAK